MMSGWLDKKVLDEQTFGDTALRTEILLMFKEQMPALLAALAATSGAARADIAHRLKGSSLAIGAQALADSASAIEENPDSDPGSHHVNAAAQATLAEIVALLAA